LTRAPSQFDQLTRGDPDHRAPVVTDLHHVLDPYATDARQVDPRLDRDHRALGKLIDLGRSEQGLFVDLETDAVAETMDEEVPIARLFDHGPSRGVHRHAGHPRPHDVDRGLLRLTNDVVDLLHVDGGLTDRYRPGHVGVVAVVERSDIEFDHVVFLELAVAGLAVGPRLV